MHTHLQVPTIFVPVQPKFTWLSFSYQPLTVNFMKTNWVVFKLNVYRQMDGHNRLNRYSAGKQMHLKQQSSSYVYVSSSCQTVLFSYPDRFLHAFSSVDKANARVKPAKTGHGPHSSKIFVLFYVLFVLCHSVCVCVNVYCTTAIGWLPNSS